MTRRFLFTTMPFCLILGGFLSSAIGQTLADRARQERERRKNAPASTAVFTTDDLQTGPASVYPADNRAPTVSSPVAAPRTLEAIAVQDAPDVIVAGRNRPVLVMLYASWCPYCRSFFSTFIDLAQRHKAHNLVTLAFSIDENPEDLNSYLGNKELPFRKLWIRPWQPGQLDSAMKPVGFQIGATFGIPFVAVIDRNGRVAAQWTGVPPLEKLQAALASVGVSD